MKTADYERDAERFGDRVFVHEDDRRVAWRILGWELQADEDTEWTGEKVRTDYVCAVMVGDDRIHRFLPEEMEELPEGQHCSCCGQVGCQWG